MLFSSQIFILIFLPLTLIAYYYFSGKVTFRIWLLILASLIFYGYWDIRFIPLLLISVSVNWFIALYYKRLSLKLLIAAGVVFNLLAIGFFKYFNFFVSVADGSFERWSIILPLGISFFTFQQISYLIDLKRNTAPLYKFDHYFLYVVFFPQLIAGPIVRHDELIPQLDRLPTRKGLDKRISQGFTLFILGLAKKVLIADQMIPVVDQLFNVAHTQTLSFAEGWLAAIAYTMQLYFDFAAYSDMAIGLGLMFGFMLPKNFDAPYRATSIREFWRKWHMTLSRFLRDYLYIPMGGNRVSFLQQIGAIMITMLLCGLWHGAGWTFIIWGGVHGIAIVANNAWHKTSFTMPIWLGWTLTMIFVVCGWVLFRAENFQLASNILASMWFVDGVSMEIQSLKRLWLIPIAVCLSLFGPTAYQLAIDKLKPSRFTAVIFGLLLVYITLEIGKGQVNEFIYFQF